jgi:hypothetical protein
LEEELETLKTDKKEDDDDDDEEVDKDIESISLQDKPWW